VNLREAPLEMTEHGLVCKGDGGFVVNAREVRWFESEGWESSPQPDGTSRPGDHLELEEVGVTDAAVVRDTYSALVDATGQRGRRSGSRR
jgi:hypothetical protein